MSRQITKKIVKYNNEKTRQIVLNKKGEVYGTGFYERGQKFKPL